MSARMERLGQGGVNATGRARRRGSLAIELALVLLIFLLAGWLVLEVVGRLQQRRRCAAFIAELRELGEAIQRLSPQVRADPRAVAEALNDTAWSKGSAVGGTYEWSPSAANAPAHDLGAIAVTAFAPNFPLSTSRADLLRVDQALDDGNLATGRFRTGFNGWPVYRLDVQR